MRVSTGIEIEGRYRLEEPVGSGGMATVWRARDLRLGRDVAVKVIAETRAADPGFVDRFEREAQIAARISHPNLVSIHDLGFHEGRPYLVMEFIDGETLSRRLDRAPETVDALELARTLLGVLVALHDEGIVHRDVKPANVLYEDDGRIRLIDFGIARIVGSTSITRTHEVIGTRKYMAPEVRDGAAPSPAADLYALGVLLAEAGASDGPLATLVSRLRSPDVAQRPAGARLALLSIAGLASEPPAAEPRAEPEQAERTPTDVLRERPQTTSPPSPPAGPASPAARTFRAPRRPRPMALAIAGGLVAALAALAIALTVLGGEDDGTTPDRASSESRAQRADSGRNQAGTDTPSARTAEPEPAQDPAPEPEPAATAGDPARGSALNERGYALLQEGDAPAAVPILRRAVASWPEGSDDINYAYALYNLGVALRASGRPEEAIPYLEQRLNWNDQRQTVRAELEAARAQAE